MMYHILCSENIWVQQALKSYNMYRTYNKISSSPLLFTTDVHHDMQIIRQ